MTEYWPPHAEKKSPKYIVHQVETGRFSQLQFQAAIGSLLKYPDVRRLKNKSAFAVKNLRKFETLKNEGARFQCKNDTLFAIYLL